MEKAAMLLLTDYRSGVLGRVSLETPKSREAMLAEASASVVQPESEPDAEL
jgi:ribosome biogenesis GTPase A